MGERTMRWYAGIATGTVAAMIAFDAIWNLTTKPVEDCLALSFFIGLAVALGFILLAGLFSEKKHRPRNVRQARFVKTESGLSVMIQKSGRRAS